MQDYYWVKRCRICQKESLKKFLSLGKIPLPNNYISKKSGNAKEKKFPLDVCFCRNCGMVELQHVVDPKIMFEHYTYVPSTSDAHIKHFNDLAITATQNGKIPKDSLVLDIGSNDGSLLKSFKAIGMNVLGIDLAKNLVKRANLNGIKTIYGAFNSQSAEKILKQYGKVDIITATNVWAHIDNLKDAVKGIEVILSDKGVFIAEFPYLIDMLEKFLFDTIYHEHLSYLSVTAIVKLLDDTNLSLVDVERIPQDGGALRIFIKRKSTSGIKQSVKELLRLEDRFGIKTAKSYTKFRNNIVSVTRGLVKLINKLNKKGKKIAAYGASAKGNILLNFCHLTSKDIIFIADKNPLKQNKYAPGTRVEVVSPKKIKKVKPDYLLVLAWNFIDEIMKEQKWFKESGGRFILPVPKAKIL